MKTNETIVFKLILEYMDKNNFEEIKADLNYKGKDYKVKLKVEQL